MKDASSPVGRLRWTPILIIAVVVIAVWWWWPCFSQPVTTIFLVRHADKAGANVDALHDPLGTDRADELARVLGAAGITAIYHSDTVRNEKTAEPLALALGLTPVEYPALDTQPLVADILADHRGERVLVVGHSNTVPDIIARLGGVPFPELVDTDYDNLFSVTLCPCTSSSPTVVRLEYGAETPP